MGNILPASITNPQLTGPNALPNRALFNNGNINYGAAIGDIGDILRGLGGPAGSWDPILQRRAQEDAAQRQHAVEAQHYQDQLKQQQFANDLANRTLQVKAASLMRRAGGLNNASTLSPAAGYFGGSNTMPTMGQQPSISNQPPVLGNQEALNIQPPNAPNISSSQPQQYGPQLTVEGANELGLKLPINNTVHASDFITPDSLTDRGRNAYARIARVQPKLANDIINVANHQVPLDGVLKNWKNPQDRDAITQALFDINPNYDDLTAKAAQKVQTEVANPKSEYGDLVTLAELQRRNRQLQAVAQHLPGGNIRPLNHYFWDKVAEATNDTNLANYNSLMDLYTKPLEKGALGGKPTLATMVTAKENLLPELGPRAVISNLKTQQDNFNLQLMNAIRGAYLNSRGASGIPQSLIDPTTLKDLQNNKQVRIRRDGIVVPITNNI